MPLANTWLASASWRRAAKPRVNPPDCLSAAGSLPPQSVAFDPVEQLGLSHRDAEFSVEPLRVGIILVRRPFHAAAVVLDRCPGMGRGG